MAKAQKTDFESALYRAKLKLSPESKKRLKNDVEEIIAFAGVLSGAETGSAEPAAHIVPASNALRDDIPFSMFGRDELLENAPSKTDEYILVPKVIE
jgi:aspartyl-tRNA(Asn)/glutamyl-tRNA(Gln) amidotransferase subunit C